MFYHASVVQSRLSKYTFRMGYFKMPMGRRLKFDSVAGLCEPIVYHGMKMTAMPL